MDPQIQYAKTDDGVSIAYWTLGSGPALVRMPTDFFSHLQLEWQIPATRRAFERLAEGRMLVRYDGRGLGLSDRDVTEISLETYLLDLRAVIDRLEVDRVVLMAPFFTGAVAVSIAARHPELV
jgi:pimeloyl-ACP methyl ester carboxylesterase